jgi:hypothetical protein
MFEVAVLVLEYEWTTTMTWSVKPLDFPISVFNVRSSSDIGILLDRGVLVLSTCGSPWPIFQLTPTFHG